MYPFWVSRMWFRCTDTTRHCKVSISLSLSLMLCFFPGLGFWKSWRTQCNVCMLRKPLNGILSNHDAAINVRKLSLCVHFQQSACFSRCTTTTHTLHSHPLGLVMAIFKNGSQLQSGMADKNAFGDANSAINVHFKIYHHRNVSVCNSLTIFVDASVWYENVMALYCEEMR